VHNLPKAVAQLLPRVGFEPTTGRSQVQRSIPCATAPLSPERRLKWEGVKNSRENDLEKDTDNLVADTKRDKV